MNENKKGVGAIIGATGVLGSGLLHTLEPFCNNIYATSLKSEILKTNTIIPIIDFDISNNTDRKNIVDKIKLEHNFCDFLIITYGPFLSKNILNANEKEILQTIESNAVYPILMAREFEELLERSKNSMVVFFAFSGVELLQSKKNIPIYAAAKTALVVLAKSLKLAWKNKNIDVKIMAVPPITNVPKSMNPANIEAVVKKIKDIILYNKTDKNTVIEL